MHSLGLDVVRKNTKIASKSHVKKYRVFVDEKAQNRQNSITFREKGFA